MPTRKCQVCHKSANYGVPPKPGEPKHTTHCSKHKDKITMINLTAPRCQVCNSYAVYGVPPKPGEPKRIACCSKHKDEIMINLTSPRCQVCNDFAVYGVPPKPGETKLKTRCFTHKDDTMINLVAQRCQVCNEFANYGVPPKPGESKHKTHCSKHKHDTMIDLVSSRCKLCHMIRSTKKYNYLCVPCFYHTNPHLEASRKFYQTRQNHLFARLKVDFPGIFQYDQTVKGGCSNRRPDVFLDLLTHVLVGEHDEGQHTWSQCDDRRNMELMVDCGNRPMVILRINPDAYTDKWGNKHASTFSYDKNMVLTVDTKMWNARYQVLYDRIQYWIKNIPIKEVTEEKLFFDDCNYLLYYRQDID